MTEEFGVTPDELRRVSAELHDVSSAMKAVMSSLRAQLAAEGPVWGDGEMGRQFADGPDGYLAQLNWVNGSVDAKTGLLDYYADLLKQAADTFQQSDESGSPVPGTLAAQSGALSGHGMAGAVPAGAIGGTNRSHTSVGAPRVPAAGTTAEVGPPANAGASPTTATGSNATTGGIAGSSGASTPAMGAAGGRSASGTSGVGSQNDPTGEGSDTNGAPVAGGSPDDGVPAGVRSGDPEGANLEASTSEGAPDPLTASPDAEPFTDGAGPPASGPPAPPFPPVLPNPPAPPNPRRGGAPDDPSSRSPVPTGDRQPGRAEPSAATRADAGAQRAGPKPIGGGLASGTDVGRAAQKSSGPPTQSGSVARRAGAVEGDVIRPEGAARARRGGPDSSRRSGDRGDTRATADDGNVIAGDPDGSGDNLRGSGEPVLGEDLWNPEGSEVPGRPDGMDTDVDEIATERRASEREDSGDP